MQLVSKVVLGCEGTGENNTIRAVRLNRNNTVTGQKRENTQLSNSVRSSFSLDSRILDSRANTFTYISIIAALKMV